MLRPLRLSVGRGETKGVCLCERERGKERQTERGKEKRRGEKKEKEREIRGEKKERETR